MDIMSYPVSNLNYYMATHNVFIHIFPQYTLFFYILRGKNAFV